jgi:hypothetical protein
VTLMSLSATFTQPIGWHCAAAVVEIKASVKAAATEIGFISAFILMSGK